MRLGVVLPTFTNDVDEAFDAALAAERDGLDGVFVYDHLWPIGHPGRPAVLAFPVLGALAATTTTVTLGTLVARAGLVANDLLVRQLLTVAAVSSGRFIAGIGTGDRKGAPEFAGYGVPLAPADERRTALEEVARTVTAAGVVCWIGGGSPETNAVARRLDLALNLWGATPQTVADHVVAGPVTWGGNLPGDVTVAGRLLAALAVAGATWVVVGWPGSTAPLLRAAEAAGLR